MRTEPQQSTLCQTLMGPTLISLDGEHNHLGSKTPHLQHSLTIQFQVALPHLICKIILQTVTVILNELTSSDQSLSRPVLEASSAVCKIL